MAFDINNFREAGGPGNSQSGGQLYSQFSDADTLATMLADSYMDAFAYKLRVRDMILMTGTDGVQLVQVVSISSADVVVVGTVGNAGAIEALTGTTGAVSIATEMTEMDTTAGAAAYTLADGAIGQTKTVVLNVDGGNAVLTPATGAGYTTITFADAGDSVTLRFGAIGWYITGQGGLGTGPLSA